MNPKNHTFTVHVTIRNLMADMAGDESQNRLPHNFAMRASLLALREDNEGLNTLHNELIAAGWACFTVEDLTEARKFKHACYYCIALINATI